MIMLDMQLICYIDKSYLYNCEYPMGEYAPVVVLAARFSPGKKVLFDVLVGGGGLFCDIPIDALYSRYPSCSESARFGSDVTHPRTTPNSESKVMSHSYEYMKNLRFNVFHDNRKILDPVAKNVEYVMSFEFLDANELWHLVSCESTFMLVPNPSLTLNTVLRRPDFKKLRHDFSIPSNAK